MYACMQPPQRGKSPYKLAKERKNHDISRMMKPYLVKKKRVPKVMPPAEAEVLAVEGKEEAPVDDYIEAPEAEGFKQRTLKPGEE